MKRERKEDKMIIDLVCEAVEIKIHFENFTGVLQSNYEFAYALGLMEKKLGIDMDNKSSLHQLKELVEDRMKQFEPADYIEANLVKLIREYRIDDSIGAELEELIKKGYEAVN